MLQKFVKVNSENNKINFNFKLAQSWQQKENYIIIVIFMCGFVLVFSFIILLDRVDTKFPRLVLQIGCTSYWFSICKISLNPMEEISPYPEALSANSYSFLSASNSWKDNTQPVITCLMLTMETLEQGMIYVQS